MLLENYPINTRIETKREEINSLEGLEKKTMKPKNATGEYSKYTNYIFQVHFLTAIDVMYLCSRIN